MPLFRYEVQDESGKYLRGAMDARTESEVRERLAAKGYLVRTVFPGDPSSAPASRYQSVAAQAVAPVALGATSKISAPPGEMAVFFRSLASYLTAGVSVFHSLSRIADQSPNRNLRTIAQRLASRVQAGERLSVAMAGFPKAFPPHVVGLVSAGELGGFLPVVIGDIALDYEIAQRASGRSQKFWSWMLWSHVYGFLLVAPLLPSIFSSSVDPSAGAGAVVQIVRNYLSIAIPWVVVPLFVLTAGYFGAASVLRRPNMRPMAHKLLLSFPWARRASRQRSLASFTRVLWRLQNAGVPAVQAWDAACRAAENSVVARRLHAQLEMIRSGARFSEAIASSGEFTSEDHRVLGSGEESGHAVESLQRIAAYYEDAALVSAGRARWLGVRIAFAAFLVSLGVVLVSFALFYRNMFTWVDTYFGPG